MEEKELQIGDKILRSTPYGNSFYVITRVTKTEAIAKGNDVEMRYARKYTIMENSYCKLTIIPKSISFNPLIKYKVIPKQI